MKKRKLDIRSPNCFFLRKKDKAQGFVKIRHTNVWPLFPSDSRSTVPAHWPEVDSVTLASKPQIVPRRKVAGEGHPAHRSHLGLVGLLRGLIPVSTGASGWP